jgi:hypothetical protein
MEQFIERGRYPVQMKPPEQRTVYPIFIPDDFHRSVSLLQQLENLLCELAHRNPVKVEDL